MTGARLKGFNIFPDRHGHMRCYHRKTGIAIDLKKAPIGSAEFFAECAKIAVVAEQAAAIAKETPGTLGILIHDYRKAAAFQDLAPRTKADYQRIFEYLRPIADTPLAKFDRPLVVRIRDKAAASKGRRFANYIKAVLSIMFAWGRERGKIADNPASAIKNLKRPRDAPEANRPWSDAERHVVLDEASPALRPALALMMFTGLGPKDALTLPRNLVRDGEIGTRRSKTGEPVFWEIPEPLAAILDQAPKAPCRDTLCPFRGPPMVTGRLFRTLDGVAQTA